MARFLPILPMQNPSFLPLPITFFFLLIGVLSVFSIIKFLCASHKTNKKEGRTVDSSEKKLLSKLNSNISSKAHLMVKMISWRKDVKAEEDDEEALWRKNIMMGERCRPLDFSGKIVYDSEGNLLPESDSAHHQDQSKKINVPSEKS